MSTTVPIALPIGRYAGVPLQDVPTAYLKWTRRNTRLFSPAVNEACRAELGRRGYRPRRRRSGVPA